MWNRFRGQDVPKQLLFAMGDFEKNTRTHHIHVVEWNSVAWNNYINFRDYLNTFTDKAKLYDSHKQNWHYSLRTIVKSIHRESKN